jgi:ornithine carbamoyltransferase
METVPPPAGPQQPASPGAQGRGLPTIVPPKDFLSVLDLGHEALARLLALAAEMKRDRRLGRYAPTAAALAGAHVALLFEKASLRTRCTFEIAVRELGGDTVSLSTEFASGTREPLEDVARNLERWVRALVIRTYAQEKAQLMANAAGHLHVIHALTDQQHPCQALADALTMRERWGDVRGRTLAFVGDGNNVATSLAHATSLMGINLRLASPEGYDLPDAIVDEAQRVAQHGATIRRCRDPLEAVAGVDAVYTDVWASMGQESEAAARQVIFAPYQVNASLMASAAPGALFMHCLPAHRGEEVTGEVIESPTSTVFDQAENRLHAQKALLLMLLGEA